MKWKLGEYRDLRNLTQVTIRGKPDYLNMHPILRHVTEIATQATQLYVFFVAWSALVNAGL